MKECSRTLLCRVSMSRFSSQENPYEDLFENLSQRWRKQFEYIPNDYDYYYGVFTNYTITPCGRTNSYLDLTV